MEISHIQWWSQGLSGPSTFPLSLQGNHLSNQGKCIWGFNKAMSKLQRYAIGENIAEP